jgi:hypothetical protein
MTKSLKTQKVNSPQPLEQDAVPPSLTKEEKENSDSLQNVLSVALLMLDKLALEIGSQDKLFLAYHSVKQSLSNDVDKQKTLDKLMTFMEKRRNDNIFVKGGFF